MKNKYSIWVRVGLSLAFLTQCSSFPNRLNFNKDSMMGKKVILFVPGLYGSHLSDVETGDRIFQTFSNALWGSIPLALHGKELKIFNSRELKADGIFEGISIIPFLYTVDAYGGTMDYLTSEFGSRNFVIPFAYDWRREDSESAQALGAKIQELKTKGASSIALVGHSLGAALIAYYLRYGIQSTDFAKENWDGVKNVDSVVLASLPFRGSMSAFRDFLEGTAIGLAKTPLGAVSLGSFPSFYQFLPPESSKDYLNSELSEIGTAIYETENWPGWSAGLFRETEVLSSDLKIQRMNYTARCLEQAKKYSALMRAEESKNSPVKTPALFFLGKGHRTLSKAIGTNKGKNLEGKWIFEANQEGDGLVTLASQTPPDALLKNLNSEIVTLEMPHRGVYTRSDVQEKVTEFLKGRGY